MIITHLYYRLVTIYRTWISLKFHFVSNVNARNIEVSSVISQTFLGKRRSCIEIHQRPFHLCTILEVALTYWQHFYYSRSNRMLDWRSTLGGFWLLWQIETLWAPVVRETWFCPKEVVFVPCGTFLLSRVFWLGISDVCQQLRPFSAQKTSVVWKAFLFVYRVIAALLSVA